jgi:hypothetical protein
MCLNDLLPWCSSLSFQAIDILREQFQQQPFVVQQLDEGVCYGGTVFTGVKLVSEGVERERILAEVGDVEDSFSER